MLGISPDSTFGLAIIFDAAKGDDLPEGKGKSSTCVRTAIRW
jgi:hypothetical protein